MANGGLSRYVDTNAIKAAGATSLRDYVRKTIFDTLDKKRNSL